MNKICTSIEQSQKLIELGIDRKSSDMYWWSTSLRYYIEAMDDGDFNEAEGHVPAWSLAALLAVLPKGINISTPKPVNEFGYCCWNQYDEIYADNPIDACVAMIEKLHEQKLL